MAISNHVFDQWIQASEAPAGCELFFIGALDIRITFYSQQVRALRLVHALHARNRLAHGDRIAIVGAGAAGTTAALACVALGARVDLIEQAPSILPLQSSSPRLLHPHIYDWPLLGSLQESAVLPLLDWEAAQGRSVRARLEEHFETVAKARPTSLNLMPKTRVSAVERDGGEWALTLTCAPAVDRQKYDKVILAIGFGEEMECGDARRIDYWRDAHLGSDLVEMTPKRYFVSGSGDGGLTDMMAVLIRNFEHLSFTKEFLNLFRGSALGEAVHRAESSVSAIGGDLGPHFQQHVVPILHERGAIKHLAGRLRDDRSLVFNADGPILAKGKAARLNQVMALALKAAAASTAGGPLRLSTGRVTTVTKEHGCYRVEGPLEGATPLDDIFDEVVLRHGPNRRERYSPVTRQFEEYSAHLNLLRTRLPSVDEPPQLAPETFEFFDHLVAENFVDLGSRQGRKVLAAQRRTTVIVSWDLAEHRPVQQGPIPLLEVAERVDTLSQPLTLLFDLLPSQLSEHADILLRLTRASGHNIRVVAAPAASDAWRQRDPMIAEHSVFTTPYPAQPLPEPALLWSALEQCLIRQLDSRLRKAVAAGTCEELGDIHPSIATTLVPLWLEWRTVIDADPAMRQEFLRLLVQVEQAGQDRWDGQDASLPSFVAALVLMLATHAGEKLVPACCPPGNLMFGDDAVGLGSGCRLIHGRPITSLRDAEAWNVDALILSGAAEQIFEDPGLISDGGTPSRSLQRPARVAPAVIQNTYRWRTPLGSGLADWQNSVRAEFAAWRARQDATLREK